MPFSLKIYMNFKKTKASFIILFLSYLCLIRGYQFTIQLQAFLPAQRAPWPDWPLASQIFQFSGVAPVNALYVTEKYPQLVLLKIDQYKDGCYLKHICRVGTSLSLSLS